MLVLTKSEFLDIGVKNMSRWTLYDNVCTSLEDCELRKHGLCQAGLYGEGIEKQDCYEKLVVEQDKSKLYTALFTNQRKIFETQKRILKQKER